VSAHVEDRLFDWALGTLAGEERAAVDVHLLSCARCRLESMAVVESLALYPASLPSVTPSPEARLRLLQATRPVQPLQHLEQAGRLATFFDLSPGEARSILEKSSSPPAWAPSGFPGLHLLHVSAGPKYAGADAGLVRIDAGVSFPRHRHDGTEHTLVLAGSLTTDDGRTLAPGDELVMPIGSSHSLTVSDEGCLYALVLFEGIDIDGIGKVRARR